MLIIEEYRFKLLAMEKGLTDLKSALNIDNTSLEVEKLEEETHDESFWQDLDNSSLVLQKIKNLKQKIESYTVLFSLWEDMLVLCDMLLEDFDEDLVPELETGTIKLEDEIEKLSLSTLLTGEYDKNNVILSFHSGAGGTEAQDWAEMLYRLYTRWAERRGFKYKILDYIDGDEAGLKSADILIEGENAFGYLKSEMGVHRLVRISPFDSSGRRHTSFAALEVMPEITDDVKIEINPDDLRVDTYRSGGAGGQHVNKTESAIRITHIPSGVVVACQNERSQHQNREMAMRMLKSKLVQIRQQEHLARIEDIKGVQKKIEWGNQIRSYVFMPYTLVKDHRTNFENGNVNAVMDGDIDGFINAYLKALVNGEL